MVGIKVNCSGAPGIMSTPEVVAEIVRNLNAVGVPPAAIWIYERFKNQMDSVHYDRYVPAGVHIEAAEDTRGAILRYDPDTYVEVNFFGEEDTRSNMTRLVTERFTKIINVPNMKDHGASGVTGCLKNIAYGDFSNVARSHHDSKTNTLSFIGTLASVEPLRSRTVLQVMDGLRGGVARRSVLAEPQVPLLSQTDDVRHGPGGDRPAADRHYRPQARRRARHFGVGPVAQVPDQAHGGLPARRPQS